MPPLSAELRAAHDREFAEQLQRRLAEKNAAGGKIEPIFKAAAAPKPAVRPARPEPDAATRGGKPQDARKSNSIRVEESREPAAAMRIPPAAAPFDDHVNDRAAAVVPSLPALPLVMRAALFAADRHKTQRRRGAAREPYINHLLEVSALLATATDGRDPDLVIAGLLHDLIEDQGVGADDIARQFGVGVAALVLEVTTDKTLSEDERTRVQILHAAHKSPRARMLRIADLTSNLRALRQSPPADWSSERQRDYFRWAHEVVARSRGLSPQLDAAFDEAYSAGPPPQDTARPEAS